MVLFELKGIYRRLYLFNDKIVIKRKRTLVEIAKGFFIGDITFYLTQISSIEVREGTTLINGYIKFTLAGSNEKIKGRTQNIDDDNLLMFTKENNELVKKIKLKIEEIKDPMQSLIKIESVEKEIINYKELLDQGIITEKEFAIKKKELLNL